MLWSLHAAPAALLSIALHVVLAPTRALSGLPPLSPTGKLALDYFHTQCPCLAGLKEGENEAEWLVDLTTQVGVALPCSPPSTLDDSG